MSVPPESFDFDLAVIGGGSGGLACAQEAAKRLMADGKEVRIAVFDWVEPSPNTGTRWGLGGTCVNVGCIPKKLMHFASHAGDALIDADKLGWQWAQGKGPASGSAQGGEVVMSEGGGDAGSYGVKAEKPQFKWSRLVEAVQDHIGSLNWGYRSALREKNVQYINSRARFVDPWTLEATARNKKTTTHTARHILIATGGRPTGLDCPGSELCITSDDIFSHGEDLGKVLCVGASYIALECASFLTGIGMDTTVMVRSIFLRGYDQEMAEKVAEYMQMHNTKFIRPAVPTRIEQTAEGRKQVFWTAEDGSEQSDVFDTVLVAVGRHAESQYLNYQAAGITTVDQRTGKFIVNDIEQTNVDHIYALGDVIYGRPELTPVAIQAGRLLARRLVAGGTAKMDYNSIPTTVFTHLEYACVGLSEEDAAIKCGNADDGKPRIEVWHSYFKPLEWTVTEREDNVCFCKVITERPADGSDPSGNERILGIHYLGPHAGEVIAGFAAAMRLGLTKNDLDATVGVHPTSAEEFVNMNLHTTKRSGLDAKKNGC